MSSAESQQLGHPQVARVPELHHNRRNQPVPQQQHMLQNYTVAVDMGLVPPLYVRMQRGFETVWTFLTHGAPEAQRCLGGLAMVVQCLS